MGGIIILFPPNDDISKFYEERFEKKIMPLFADEDAEYEKTIEIDIDGLQLLISRPGHPEDVVRVDEVKGQKIDSGFIGSCTNGRLEDMRAAAQILKGRTIAPGRVLKVGRGCSSCCRKFCSYFLSCIDQSRSSSY